ncbi:epidermal differentiation-specific protein-like [Trichomycterus rosablanca]|uniref:epidermal differentiation-specific protein-like n=1 Tax=Trichomycterus rosablanca TaxID=2290929 RepID=UPI002F3609DD
MNKIIVYQHVNFGALSKEFTSDVSNLLTENFNDCISSLKVIGNPWVTYENINYSGSQRVYEEGEYAMVESNDSISSLRLVREDLSNPQITLYEDSNYRGRSIVINCETNLCLGTFNDRASSHRVQRGAWVLYQDVDRGGAQMVARAGEELSNYGWFNDRLSHLRPLMPGKGTVVAEVLWDKMTESESSVTIDKASGDNPGTHERSFSTELTRDYEGSITETFNFSSSTEVSYGMSFEIDIFGSKVGHNLSISKSWTVARGQTNTRTERSGVKVTLPAVIPPKTRLTVYVIRKTIDVKVPVKLTITRGFTTKVEYGEYRSSSGTSISTQFKEENI